jgi:hypothetical protein
VSNWLAKCRKLMAVVVWSDHAPAECNSQNSDSISQHLIMAKAAALSEEH